MRRSLQHTPRTILAGTPHYLLGCALLSLWIACPSGCAGKDNSNSPLGSRNASAGLDALSDDAKTPPSATDSLLDRQAKAMEALKNEAAIPQELSASLDNITQGAPPTQTNDSSRAVASELRARPASQSDSIRIADAEGLPAGAMVAAEQAWKNESNQFDAGLDGFASAQVQTQHNITNQGLANKQPIDEGNVTTHTRTPVRPGARAAFAGDIPQEDELTQTAKRMAALLVQQNKDGKPMIPDAAALTPIEAMSPGALSALDDPRSPLAQKLSNSERKTLIDARERLLASPDALGDLKQSVRGLAAQGVRIDTAALCTRVTGFGQYQAYPSSRFLAGQPLRAIVYSEVSNFVSREDNGGNHVELSQSLSLFSNADDLLVWHSPQRAVVETSKNTRRDFYLIQQIELPRTLSVGKYNLKITITDNVSKTTSQRILPVEMVAQQ